MIYSESQHQASNIQDTEISRVYLPRNFVITGNVNQRFHFRGNIGKINRRTNDNCIGFNHFFDTKVEMVIFNVAFSVLNFLAFTTGCASVNRFVAQLNKLGFNSFILKNFEHRIDKDCRVAVSSWASVKCCYFHG